MWINTETNAYPLYENDIRALMPNTSFAQPFNPPEPYVWVAPTPRPAHDSITEGVRQIAPELVEGVYEQRWEVYALSEEQSAANLAAFNRARFNQIVAEAQARLDAFARTRNYDDIKSASDYAGCTVERFNIEGTYCRDVRAQTWDALYAMLDEVNAGDREIPASLADIEDELPPLVWPT